MAYTWEQLVYYCDWNLLSAHTDADVADGLFLEARTHYYAAEYEPALIDCISGCMILYDSVKHLIGYTNWGSYWYLVAEMFYRMGEAEPPELKMEDIINAMLKAEPDEVMYFVGLADAFRQSIWNRPFNEEFFAALARGFMP